MTRYDELLAELPRGSFYGAPSQVLPYRTSNYEFIFDGVNANRIFRVYTNGTFRGLSTSNGAGEALVSILLAIGRQDITIIDSVTGDKFYSFVTVKHGATVLAANAAAIETVDDQLESVRLAFGLETAPSQLIEDVYGTQVAQPNDLGSWLTDTYRNLLADLRQAYRLFGSKLRGIRQAVLAFTSSVPLRVSRAWRPWWRLGFQLLPVGDFQARARVFTDQEQLFGLATLNAHALDYVHAAYAGSAPNVFPGPTVGPPTSQQLYLTFAAGWSGGTVTITGVDPLGNSIVDSVVPTQVQPIAILERVESVLEFASITSITKSLVGAAATVSVGVRDSRFVKVTGISSPQRLGAIELRYLLSGGVDYLRWDGGLLPQVDTPIPVSGTYTIGSGAGLRPLIVGLARDTGAGFTLGTDRYNELEMDRLGRVLVRFSTTPITAVNAAAEINTSFGIDPRYGAVRATGTITCIAQVSIIDGETVTIGDGISAAVVFEFRTAGPVTPGNVLVSIAVLASANDVATALATAINGVGGPPRNNAGPAGNKIRVTASATGFAGGVTLTNHFGGTAGNVAITDTVANAGFTHTGMSGGTDSAYNSVAATEASVAALGTAVVLVGNASTLTGPSGVATIAPVGAPATGSVWGLPRYSTTTDAAVAFRALSLDTSVGAGPFNQRIPLPAQNILLSAPFLDTAATAAPTAQPSHPTALEIVFDAAWRGGTVRVDGTDREGNIISDTFADPTTSNNNLVASASLNATSADVGITITFASVANLASVRVGDFFRVTSGASAGQGAFIQRVIYSGSYLVQTVAGIVLEGAGIGANFTSQSWDIRRSATILGTEAFATVTALVNLMPQAAGDNGQCWLSILHGRDACIPMWLGRGTVRTNAVSAGAPDVVAPVGQDFGVVGVAGLFTYPTDAGGWLLLDGMDAEGGRNRGLHKILKTWNLDATSNAVILVEHQDTGLYFGQFATENPFPVGATWGVYSSGELVYVAENNRATGTLTLFPPGVTTPMPLGTQVAVASELPFESIGEPLGLGSITVEVDKNFTPTTTPVFESLTVSGQGIADGWTLNNATADVTVDSTARSKGYLVDRFTLLSGTGAGDTSIQKNAPLVLDYRGLQIKIDAWVQQHISATENFRIDVDFGAGFSNGANQAVASTGYDATFGGSRDPTWITRTVEVPYNATQCIVRLTHAGSAAGDLVRVEKIMVTATTSTGLYLGENTIGLNEDRAYFGEVLYAWSFEELTAAERAAMGLPEVAYPTTLSNVGTKQGHIDMIANAHGRWSRYDLSQFNAGVPVNVQGAYDEVGWAAATLTNMVVGVGTPPRMSYVAPTRASLVERELLSITVPSNATLSQPYTAIAPFPATPADDEQLFEYDAAGVYPDGLIVPSTPLVTGGVLPWRFIAANAVQIASVAAGDPAAEAVYNAASTYRLTYRTLVRVETAVIDLGASFADYLWLLDAAIYQRKQPSSSLFSKTQQLVFAADFRAQLSVPSDQNRVTTTVTVDTGLVKRTLDPSNWRYFDQSTIEIRTNAFSSTAVYSIEYQALEPRYDSPTSVLVEERSATTSIGVAGATYETRGVDAPVDRANRYHQIRATITGITDTRDIRVYGLGLRGLQIYTTPAVAPGIVLP